MFQVWIHERWSVQESADELGSRSDLQLPERARVSTALDGCDMHYEIIPYFRRSSSKNGYYGLVGRRVIT